jgi:hypothetical protein
MDEQLEEGACEGVLRTVAVVCGHNLQAGWGGANLL